MTQIFKWIIISSHLWYYPAPYIQNKIKIKPSCAIVSKQNKMHNGQKVQDLIISFAAFVGVCSSNLNIDRILGLDSNFHQKN